MGIVLGTYFGLWALFSLVVRFLVPSPKIETTLPTYTPSPIPVPVVLHSPSRSDAVPTSSAIRLHPAGSAVAPVTSTGGVSGSGSGPTPRVTIMAPGGTGQRSAPFADDGDATDDDVVNSSSRYSPSIPPSRTQQSNNVTFQTRPRGFTTDSAQSAEFPTFAAYRQSQHGNFEALTQRFKRGFALSQQTNEQQQQQQQMAMMQSPTSGDLLPSMSTDPPSYSQTTGNFPVSSPTAIPLTATTVTTETSGTLGARYGCRLYDDDYIGRDYAHVGALAVAIAHLAYWARSDAVFDSIFTNTTGSTTPASSNTRQ
ncbi:hypothetical protein BGZ97_005852 [Linnemannia gamsii]|uniref:Uncharacterized protein n=1 Tax=Linnemannia gamsii TaxID=64522 RepID=A0A9P6QUT8_9FUNG|nr:hypothetical protein BGZ97_005852 [Linnemannia gamsii]